MSWMMNIEKAEILLISGFELGGTFPVIGPNLVCPKQNSGYIGQ